MIIRKVSSRSTTSLSSTMVFISAIPTPWSGYDLLKQVCFTSAKRAPAPLSSVRARGCSLTKICVYVPSGVPRLLNVEESKSLFCWASSISRMSMWCSNLFVFQFLCLWISVRWNLSLFSSVNVRGNYRHIRLLSAKVCRPNGKLLIVWYLLQAKSMLKLFQNNYL